MRIGLPVILLAGLVAGCTAERAPQQAANEAAASATSAIAAMSGGVSLMAPRVDRVAGSFASLPDHGALLAYDGKRKVTRSGAYTWHPVKLSETHALHAIGPGHELALTAPNGQPIRLQYLRHVEHENGNWSWVGRAEGAQPGSEAILTFGDKAAFGVIPQRQGGTLRLNIGGGQAWMIEADPTMLASLESARTGPRAPDHLVPPRELLRKRMGNAGIADALAAKLEAAPLSTKADATNTVDVLLGYTNGFAARLGGQSQANTRLTFMVQVANEAMAASLMPGRIRLVHTLQVTYPDNTSNQDALYALSGVSCTENSNGSLTCTDVAVPAALQPLHTARNTYGADLVSLVRVFNEPENQSCGIAWLNGAGRTPITSSDAPGGMSVVSDSSGYIFPDNQRYCREATLAHELGHNMGSAHDRDTSDGDDNILQSNEYGRYDYSFGYRTSAAGNFFTVMAYGDTGQDELNKFSNPRLNNCKGSYACGVTNQADNAQSLTNTMPIIVTFRSAVQEANVALMPQVDANADGRSDLFWHNPTAERIQPWLMNGTTFAYGVASTIGNIYRVAAVGDFNGDGRADLIWRDINRTVLWEWQAKATGGYNVVQLRTFPAGWDIGGVGDVNRDGRSDLIWHSPTQEKFQALADERHHVDVWRGAVASGRVRDDRRG
ncbi:reprolysin-like metallopeptidase [Agrilutibacter solisilvae]|uniref:VCBS repeat-containing protein n=1 Tax=Agrilutibacter solisilvae TaxID=2763317 RepID=A0A974Y2Z9_9GAMM|nr:M12 family metallo-peptidase [Lysobacter solisilvae]QSX79668.1 VCBS repeat-containing protein [Lysobacter solisilvae]